MKEMMGFTKFSRRQAKVYAEGKPMTPSGTRLMEEPFNVALPGVRCACNCLLNYTLKRDILHETASRLARNPGIACLSQLAHEGACDP